MGAADSDRDEAELLSMEVVPTRELRAYGCLQPPNLGSPHVDHRLLHLKHAAHEQQRRA